MKAESEGSVEESGKDPGSVQQETRTRPVCDTKFSAAGDSDFCPVCILRGAAGGKATAAELAGSASGSAASAEEADGGCQVRRFENFEVMLGDDGRPIELGRGAMR